MWPGLCGELMRGHIRKRGKRSWAVVVDIGHDPSTGKRRQKWETVKGTKRDAERHLAEIIHDLNTGGYVEPSRLTLADYLDEWMADYVTDSVRARTAQGYGTIVKRLKRSMGNVGLTKLKAQDVQRYYTALRHEGLSTQTVLHHHRVLRQAIGQAVKWQLLPTNPMEGVKPPKLIKPELRILKESEIQQLLQAAKDTDFAVAIHLGLHTGLRRSELCGLVWSDVDLKARTLTVVRTMVSLNGDPAHISEPKSRASRRVVSFWDETAGLLQEQWDVLAKTELALQTQVCARRAGARLVPDSLSKGFKALAESCGITGVRLHDLRHTHASILLCSGVPINVVQARMGHESIQTTIDCYGHLLPASDTQAGMVLEQHLGNWRLQNVSNNDHIPSSS